MSAQTIITISRQYASGGKEIGQKVAEKLGIPFYDKELITCAAEKSGFSQEMFENADEKASSSLLYSLLMGSYAFGSGISGTNILPINDQLFLIQSELIKKAAMQGPCVIVGRCADYVLRENKNCLNVFIHAEKAYRLQRAIQDYQVPENKAADTLVKKDKQRANYYNFYANQKWDNLDNYDLVLCSSSLGIDNTAELIVKAAAMYHQN
jgi:cytidylate kinase